MFCSDVDLESQQLKKCPSQVVVFMSSFQGFILSAFPFLVKFLSTVGQAIPSVSHSDKLPLCEQSQWFRRAVLPPLVLVVPTPEVFVALLVVLTLPPDDCP